VAHDQQSEETILLRPFTSFGETPGPASMNVDYQMKELLTEMTRQPTPNLPKPWVLQYVPPKHLRLPGYDYRTVEDTAEIDMRNMVQATAEAYAMRRGQAGRSTSLEMASHVRERGSMEGNVKFAMHGHMDNQQQTEVLRSCFAPANQFYTSIHNRNALAS